MRTILDELADAARVRVAKAKENVSAEKMREAAIAKGAQGFSFESALRKPEISFICEVKKASPSKGVIAEDFPYVQIARDYEFAGADAISVLTEPTRFQGEGRFLREIAAEVSLPLLRKDFIIDAYQIDEAKMLGASAVLLICALLKPAQLAVYLAHADALGLSSLVETHDEEEIRMALDAGARIVGVNHRNLHTFEVDLSLSAKLRPLLPKDVIFVAESGISTREDVRVMREIGADAVLIGESFMRAADKAETLRLLKA
jgi:indole-3-glycerol phosphate synthase